MNLRAKVRLAPVLSVLAALALAVTAATALASGGSGGSASTPEAERIRTVELTRLRALVDADMAVAGPLHAADFQLINPIGEALSRDEYLGAVASGDIDYLVFEPASPIEVRIYGDAAVIRYQSNIDIVVAGLGRLTHQAWHTDLYERRQGRWISVWSQATAIGPLPEPR
jgi:hypothetical protein